jgi:hypothetical protein
MDVRRRRQVRAGVCFALPALALALCTVLGLGASAAASAASDADNHGHATAMAPAPHRPAHAIVRMQDPIGFDIVAAEQSVQTSHTAEHLVPSTPPVRPSVEPGGERNRGPPAGELV